jgi:hypothetical protein
MTARHGRGLSPWSIVALGVVLVVGLPLLVMLSARGATRSAADVPAPTPSPTVGPTVAPTPAPSPAPIAVVPPLQRGLAQAAVDAAQARAAGSTELAVAVLDRGTGELAVGGRGDEPFYAASLSKLVVIVDVLDRRRLEGLEVTDADLALFERALGPSDDSAMSAIWDRFDGPGAVDRVRQRLGLSGTTPPKRAGQWGEVEITAADYVRVWKHVLDEMPPDDRDLLVGDLAAAPPVARDGFDQAFGLLAPSVREGDGPGAVAKQGWMCCFSGRYYLHSAGAVGPDRRFVVTMLTRMPRGEGWAQARGELTDIALALVAPLD